jgi:hypothetical protein
MTDPIHRGYTIFCDDIRNEIGGKTTFVGCYDAEMLVHGDFPCVLPKLAFSVRYQELRGVYTDEPVLLQIYLPGDADDEPTFSGELAAPELRKSVKLHPDARRDLPRYLQITTNIISSPLAIPKPGEILIRALCGSEVVKLGSLLVRAAEKA